MKNYLRSNKGFTTKELIFAIIAIIVAFLLGYGVSYAFTNHSQQYIKIINEQESEIQELEEQLENLEDNGYEEEYEISAEDILTASYYNIIGVAADFEYDEIKDNGQSEIKNYEEIMQELFTENGRKIFEEENKSYIQIKDGKAYISDHENKTYNYFYDVYFQDIQQTEDTIVATASREMLRNPEVTREDEIDSYELNDEIVLKKVNDNWLIDEYTWVVPELEK